MNHGLSKLRDFLAKQPPGDLSAALGPTMVPLLADCWDELEGATAEAMAAYKLNRAEEFAWEPPILSFVMERHGGTVFGSTRADLQRWEVDVERGAAGCAKVGDRQLHPMAPRVNLQGLADEVARALQDGKEHPAIERLPDGRARIVLANVIPPAGFKQTADSRRQRFKRALRERLSGSGWREVPGRNVWEQAEKPEEV